MDAVPLRKMYVSQTLFELVLAPTPEEVAEGAEYERQQKEIAQERAEKLAAKLRELNIDPDTI